MRAETRRLILMGAGYAVIALAVTVSGIVVGAKVVGPVVTQAVLHEEGPLPSTTFAARAEKRVAMWRRDVKSWPVVRKMPEAAWLTLGVGAALALAGAVAWRLRVGALVDSAETVEAVAALPAKVVVGRNSRTPRAVMALAEAGNAPSEIARRTGLSLDAVSMCLTLSSFAARQLQPPTA